ncbi:hypothetical protein OAU50_02610 [Planctomycetota bacterium]|nr:hypothetical protein [Planctomycetota bacterium]
MGGGGRARVADPTKLPTWEKPTSTSLETAASEERPILIYFAGEKENDFTVYGEDLKALSDKECLFVKIAYNADREADPYADESSVPVCKLLSDNPAREYNIKAGSKGQLVLCDWFGNEQFRIGTTTKAEAIKSMIGKIGDRVEKEEKDLRKNLDKAKASMEKEDRKNAIKSLLKNFKDGIVGLKAQQESIELYHEIMDAARDEMQDFVEKGDTAGLKKLATEMKKSDVETEIKDAIKGIS